MNHHALAQHFADIIEAALDGGSHEHVSFDLGDHRVVDIEIDPVDGV